MSKSIENRLEKIEEKLGDPNKPPTVLEIVWFGDKSDMPPEKKEGNHTTKFICFEDIPKSKQQGKL